MDNVKLVIFGGRDFNDFELLSNTIKSTNVYKEGRIGAIISGCARGADSLGKRFGDENGIPVEEYPAKWSEIEGKPAKYVKSRADGTKYYVLAGFDRNDEMAKVADIGIGFWNGSSGTADMFERCLRHNVQTLCVGYGGIDPARVTEINEKFKRPSEARPKPGRLHVVQMAQLSATGAPVLLNIARKGIQTANVTHKVALAPSSGLLGWYFEHKDYEDWWEEYVRRWEAEKKNDKAYWEAIDQIVRVLQAGGDVAIACFCRYGDRCHRSLVAKDIERRMA